MEEVPPPSPHVPNPFLPSVGVDMLDESSKEAKPKSNFANERSNAHIHKHAVEKESRLPLSSGPPARLPLNEINFYKTLRAAADQDYASR